MVSVTRSSPAYTLFQELGSIESERLSSCKAYDMLRDVLEYSIGFKTDLETFFNSQDKWITFLKRWYCAADVEAFYNMTQLVQVRDFVIPKYPPFHRPARSEVDGDNIFVPSLHGKLGHAWALGFLTASLLQAK